MNFIMMVLMLLCVYGIMALYQCITWFGGARCLALAVMTVIGIQAFGGAIGRVIPHGMSYTAVFLLLCGGFGHLMTVWETFSIRNGRIGLAGKAKERLAALYPPAVIGAGLIFLLIFLLMRGMLIFRYDDLKQWGSAAKFMTQFEWMPREEEFFGSHNHYLTPTFFTSFFGLGGKWVSGTVIEHNFYAANMLFVAAGLILPLGEIGWKKWKTAFAVLGLELLGMTALYYHSIANLYVDIILAAWVGGMVASVVQHRSSGNAFDRRFWSYCLPMLLFTVFIKWGYGLLGVGVVLLTILLCESSLNPQFGQKLAKRFQNKRLLLIWVLIAAILFVLIWSMSILMGDTLNKILPGVNGMFTAIGDILFARTDKATLTLKACLTGLFDQPVTRGTFGFGPLVGLLLVGGLGAAVAETAGEKRALLRRLNLIYLAGSVVWFMLILFVYVSNFAYAEATIALSFNRYMGIYLMIGLFVQLTFLFDRNDAALGRSLKMLVFLVLVLNINTDLVIESTALDPMQIVGYENVVAVKEQANEVSALTDPEDRILYIGQYGAERGLHRARLDVGMNVSPYKPNTYKFSTENVAGYDLSVTRAPYELPQLIIDGGYDYVWVYKSNSELNDFTEEYFGFRFKPGMLYRVVTDGRSVQLVDATSLAA